MSARMASFCQVIKEGIYYVCGKGMPSSCSSVLSTVCLVYKQIVVGAVAVLGG
jgi:hypothetical protein